MFARPALIGLILWNCLFLEWSFAAPRNVLLFVVDDQGRDAGCYGNSVVQTPNLDALAADGARFEFAFCTTASCSASRSVILTGRHNHATGQYGHMHSYNHFHTFRDIKTLPVLMSDAGYRTVRIGKFHVQPEEVYEFDLEIPANSRSTVEMAEKCREVFTANPQQPFFLYFCTSDPHRGGGNADDLPYRPDRFGNRPQGYPGVSPVKYDPLDVVVPPFLPDSPECRAELAQYYESVSRIDQGLGRLVEIMHEEGVYDETMIIYISDNGIAFPGAKTNLYEPGMRLPCIVRDPYEERRGIVCQSMINWADIAPTILEFSGVDPAPFNFHGRSFASVIGQENPDGWDTAYASHTFHEITMYYPMRVVRGRQYKLIWNIAHPLPYPFASDLWRAPTWQEVYQSDKEYYGKRTVIDYIHRPRFELYDLQNDPHEIHNLVESPDHAGLLADLQQELRRFQDATGDPWILKWEYE